MHGGWRQRGTARATSQEPAVQGQDNCRPWCRGCQDQPCAHTFPSYRLHQGRAGPAYVTLWLALSLPGGFQASGRSRNCQGTACTPRTDLFYSMASSLKQEAMGGKCAHTKLLCPLVLPGISARWCLGQDLINGKPDEVVTMAQCHSPGGLFLRLLGMLQWCPWNSARENQLILTCTLRVTWATGSGQL